MALMAMKWIEGVTGLDITGQQELEIYREREKRGAAGTTTHIQGDDDPEAILEGDQILHFLEKELWKIDTTREEAEELDSLKKRYINALNGVSFQNDQIVMLLDELSEERRTLARTKSEEVQVRIANIKLDVSDRLMKRHLKQKEKESTAEDLRSIITRLQLNRLPTALPGLAPGTLREDYYVIDGSPHSLSTPTQPTAGKAGQLKQRRRIVSEAEIKAALRRGDFED